MISNVVRLFKEIDTFREVLIFGLTGATALSLYLGYRLVQSDELIKQFTATPTIIEYHHPCYIRFVRQDFYTIGIDFPVEEELRSTVKRHTQAYIIDHNPTPVEFGELCQDLQNSILDNNDENWLRPLQKASRAVHVSK